MLSYSKIILIYFLAIQLFSSFTAAQTKKEKDDAVEKTKKEMSIQTKGHWVSMVACKYQNLLTPKGIDDEYLLTEYKNEKYSLCAAGALAEILNNNGAGSNYICHFVDEAYCADMNGDGAFAKSMFEKNKITLPYLIWTDKDKRLKVLMPTSKLLVALGADKIAELYKKKAESTSKSLGTRVDYIEAAK